MKSIALRITVAALLILFCVAGHAHAFTMRDPLVLLEFDPAKVKVEELSKSEIAGIGLAEHMAKGRWWLFARHGVDGAEYRVLGGYWQVLLDTEPVTYGAPEIDFGYVFKVVEGKHHFAFMADRIDLAVAEMGEVGVNRLYDDYVARLILAFGGTGEIQRRLDGQTGHPYLDAKMADALARAGIRVRPELVQKGPDVPWMKER